MTGRTGVRLAVDVGSVRVGVARSDADGMMSLPCGTLPFDGAISGVCGLASEHEVIEVFVGYPIGLSGEPGPAAAKAVAFARELATQIQIPVRLIDERLSTVSAAGQLRAAGRDARRSRAVIDQAAAVVILEHALATERAQAHSAGTLVGEVP